MKKHIVIWIVFFGVVFSSCSKSENILPDPPISPTDTTRPVTPPSNRYLSIVEKIEKLGPNSFDEFRYVDSISYLNKLVTGYSHTVYSPSNRFLLYEQVGYSRVGNILTTNNVTLGRSQMSILDNQTGFVLETYEKMKPPSGVTDTMLFFREYFAYNSDGYLKSSVFISRNVQVNNTYKTITNTRNDRTFTVSGGNIVKVQVIQNRVDSFFSQTTGAYMSHENGLFRYTTDFYFTGDVHQSVAFSPVKKGKDNVNALSREVFRVEKSTNGGNSWEPWLGDAEAAYTHEIDGGLVLKTNRRKVYGNYSDYLISYTYTQL